HRIAELLRAHAIGGPNVDEPETLPQDVMHVSLTEPVGGPGTPMAQREPERRHGHLEAVVLLVAVRTEQGAVDVGSGAARNLDHGTRRVSGGGRPRGSHEPGPG